MKGLIDEQTFKKAGGRFRLSVLLQKRLREYYLTRHGTGGPRALRQALRECRDGLVWLENPPERPPADEEAEEPEE